jgi:uncharacterized protein with LGFP repeats
MTHIDDKYAELGGATGVLGSPTSGEQTCADGEGRHRTFERGSIFWHPLTGAHKVHGLIHDKWAALDSERGFLGYPKGDESDSGGGTPGRVSLFQGGAITWKKGTDEAFETHGAIRSKHGEMGGEADFLGFPVTDESSTRMVQGRLQHFEHGSIYWKPSLSAREVHGHIRQYWADNGWENNPELGYPISDETPTFAGSPHRFNDFENGVVFWRHGNDDAEALTPAPAWNRPAAEVVSAIEGSLVAAIGAQPTLPQERPVARLDHRLPLGRHVGAQPDVRNPPRGRRGHPDGSRSVDQRRPVDGDPLRPRQRDDLVVSAPRGGPRARALARLARTAGRPGRRESQVNPRSDDRRTIGHDEPAGSHQRTFALREGDAQR